MLLLAALLVVALLATAARDSDAAATGAPPTTTTVSYCVFPHEFNNTMCYGFSRVAAPAATEAECAAVCCAMPSCTHWQFSLPNTQPRGYDGCWAWTQPGKPPSCGKQRGWNGRGGRPYAPTPPPPVAHGPWKDPTLSVEQRLADLIPRLTDAELLAQLSNSAGPFLDQQQYEFGQECLAGFDGGGLWASTATNLKTFPTSAFPHAVSLGMSFDKELVRSVAAAIGSEARAAHTHLGRPSLTCQSPVLNVARDPRWGRCMEVYGECPTTIAKLGAAYIAGMQHGDVGAPKTDILLVAASPKHFTDYNLECSCFRGKAGCDPENPGAGCKAPNGIGRNAYDANISAHDMRETYLAGWKAAAEAHIQGLMCSSNAVNGIPLCAHADLLNGIMRQEFGMSGAVISDGNGVTDLYHQPDMNGNNPINGKGIPGHEYAHSWPAAAADALKAGCDMSWDEDLPPQVRMGGALNGTVAQALELKLTTMDAVKAAAGHTLLPRFRVGLFDEANATVQNPWKAIPATVIQSDAHTLLARRAAAESITLLRCDAGVLPVRRVPGGVIAVVGSAANSSTLSIDRYNGHPDAAHISTFQSGIAAAAAGVAGATVVACAASASPTSCAAHLKQQGAALKLVVLVTTGHREGEQHDRADLGIQDNDVATTQAVHAALPMVPKVLVVVSGGSVSTEQVDQIVNATIWAGKGGMQAGAGFASLLFGVQDFSGRVAATIYKRAWVNASDMMDSAISGGAQPRGYRYLSPAATKAYVQYGFGHGQSLQTYSAAFSQSHYNVSSAALYAGCNVSIRVTVSVTDTIPNMQAIRSVLLFVSGGKGAAPKAQLPRRQEWLGDFEKVRISGSTVVVTLSLDREAVQRWIPTAGGESARSFTDGQYVVQKGSYSLRLTDGVATATLSVL